MDSQFFLLIYLSGSFVGLVYSGLIAKGRMIVVNDVYTKNLMGMGIYSYKSTRRTSMYIKLSLFSILFTTVFQPIIFSWVYVVINLTSEFKNRIINKKAYQKTLAIERCLSLHVFDKRTVHLLLSLLLSFKSNGTLNLIAFEAAHEHYMVSDDYYAFEEALAEYENYFSAFIENLSLKKEDSTTDEIAKHHQDFISAKVPKEILKMKKLVDSYKKLNEHHVETLFNLFKTSDISDRSYTFSKDLFFDAHYRQRGIDFEKVEKAFQLVRKSSNMPAIKKLLGYP